MQLYLKFVEAIHSFKHFYVASSSKLEKILFIDVVLDSARQTHGVLVKHHLSTSFNNPECQRAHMMQGEGTNLLHITEVSSLLMDLAFIALLKLTDLMCNDGMLIYCLLSQHQVKKKVSDLERLTFFQPSQYVLMILGP